MSSRTLLSFHVKQITERGLKQICSSKLLSVVSQEASHYPKFRAFMVQKIVGISVFTYTLS